jgi:hypothetical protein
MACIWLAPLACLVQCGGMLYLIFRSPLTRLPGLRQWHCDMLQYCFPALQSAAIQDNDASAVHLVLKNLHLETWLGPYRHTDVVPMAFYRT